MPRPACWWRAQRGITDFCVHIIVADPVLSRLRERSMLVKADNFSATKKLQSARRNKGGRAAAKLNNLRRSHVFDCRNDMPQKICVGFPASQIGQRIERQPKIGKQSRLVFFAPAMEAAQQPRPLNSPIGHDHAAVAQRQAKVQIMERHVCRRFACSHVALKAPKRASVNERVVGPTDFQNLGQPKEDYNDRLMKAPRL